MVAVLVSSGCVSTNSANSDDYKKRGTTLTIVSVTQKNLNGLVEMTTEFTTDSDGTCLMSINGDRSKGGDMMIGYHPGEKIEMATENPLPIEDVYDIGICCGGVCNGTLVKLDTSLFGDMSFCDRIGDTGLLVQGAWYNEEKKELNLSIMNFGNVTLKGFELFATYPEGKQTYNSVEVYYTDKTFKTMNLDSMTLEPRRGKFFKISANENIEKITVISSQCNNSTDFFERQNIIGLG